MSFVFGKPLKKWLFSIKQIAWNIYTHSLLNLDGIRSNSDLSDDLKRSKITLLKFKYLDDE